MNKAQEMYIDVAISAYYLGTIITFSILYFAGCLK